MSSLTLGHECEILIYWRLSVFFKRKEKKKVEVDGRLTGDFVGSTFFCDAIVLIFDSLFSRMETIGTIHANWVCC